MASYVPIHVTIFSIAECNDYGRLSVPTRTLDGYKEWHKEEVRYFPMPEVKTTSMDRDMEID